MAACDLENLCFEAQCSATRLHNADFAEHFQWLSEIVEETRKQLWGADEGNEENQHPKEEPNNAADTTDTAEPGPYLLPRTPSMKRRRKQTDQTSRLAELNASLLDSSTNTRSRRAASRVATLKMTLARQKQEQPSRKLRRPRSSCVRAEQQLMEQVRRGRHPAAAAADSDSDSDSDLKQSPDREDGRRRRPPRRAKRSPTAEPRTPPAGKRSRTRAEPASPFIRVEEKPAVRTMVRAYEALVATSDDNCTPGRTRSSAAAATPKTPIPLPRQRAARQSPAPPNQKAALPTASSPSSQKASSPGTPPPAPTRKAKSPVTEPSPEPAQSRRQTRSRTTTTVQLPPSPPPTRSATSTSASEPAETDRADSVDDTEPVASDSDKVPKETEEHSQKQKEAEEPQKEEEVMAVEEDAEREKRALRRVSSAPEVLDMGAVRRMTRTRAAVDLTAEVGTTSPTESRRQTRPHAVQPSEAADRPAEADNRRQTRSRATPAEPSHHSGEPEATGQGQTGDSRRQTRSQAVQPDETADPSPPTESRRQTRSRAGGQAAAEPPPLRRVSSAPDVRAVRAARAVDTSQTSSQDSPTDWAERTVSTASKPAKGKAARFTPQPTRTRGANIAMPADGTSFIQRAPARPTPEEVEQKRRLEVQKKREREEEAKRKRDEMIRQRTEETSLKRQERQQRALEQRRQLAEEQRRAQQQRQQRQDERAETAQRDTERKRQEEALRKRRLLAERQREVEEKRRADEQARAARARQLEEEERRRQQQQREQEQIAREKAECARLAEREAALKAQREAAQREAAQRAETKQLPPPTKAVLNSTFTMDEEERTAAAPPPPPATGPTSYQITPGRDELPPEPLRDKNNYNIDDLKSDDDTDDESAPRKEIPAWATKSRLQAALIRQTYHVLDPNTIFPPAEMFPDVRLEHIFAVPRRRFFKRTSSAHWDTPPRRC